MPSAKFLKASSLGGLCGVLDAKAKSAEQRDSTIDDGCPSTSISDYFVQPLFKRRGAVNQCHHSLMLEKRCSLKMKIWRNVERTCEQIDTLRNLSADLVNAL